MYLVFAEVVGIRHRRTVQASESQARKQSTAQYMDLCVFLGIWTDRTYDVLLSGITLAPPNEGYAGGELNGLQNVNLIQKHCDEEARGVQIVQRPPIATQRYT